MAAHDGKWTSSRDATSTVRGSQGGIRGEAGWLRWMPGLQTLIRYEAEWLGRDLMAGLVLATMLVPVGIAYAVASGLPGICGLYATIVPLLVYAVFGPSRILVLGPDSALAAVILGVVLPLSGGDPQRAVALAGMMALVSGTVCILAGLAHPVQTRQSCAGRWFYRSQMDPGGRRRQLEELQDRYR